MEREELRPLEPRRPDAGYDSQGQLIQDLSAWVDLLLYLSTTPTISGWAPTAA